MEPCTLPSPKDSIRAASVPGTLIDPNSLQLTWDPDFGFPVHVQVDEDWQSIDDEYGFSISEFTVG